MSNGLNVIGRLARCDLTHSSTVQGVSTMHEWGAGPNRVFVSVDPTVTPAIGA